MYCINIKILKDLGVDPEKPSKKKKKKGIKFRQII
jgi:hypothetical protein